MTDYKRDEGAASQYGRPKLTQEEIRHKQQSGPIVDRRKWYQKPFGKVLLGITAVYALGGILTPLGSDRRSSERITAGTVTYEWPFNRDSGTLRCEHGNAVVFEAAGRKYALNGVAQNLASRYGYASVIPLLRRDLRYPQNPPIYVSVGPIITAGLRLCN